MFTKSQKLIVSCLNKESKWTLSKTPQDLNSNVTFYLSETLP